MKDKISSMYSETHKPENIIYLVAILSLAYSFLGFGFGLDVFDEGLRVYGAERVLRGEIPYKDFYLYYSAGELWLLAALFRIFGSTLLVPRILVSLVNSTVSVLVYACARKFSSLKVALISWAMALFWISTYRFAFQVSFALLFSLLSCMFLINFLSKRLILYLAVSGLFSGITLFFRHDIGSFTAIAECLVLFLFVFSSFLPADNSLPGKLKTTLKFMGYYLVSLALVLAPIIIYLLRTVPASELVNDLIGYPHRYAKFYSLPFPAIIPNPAYLFSGVLSVSDYFYQLLLRLDYYFPSTVYLATLAVTGWQIRKGRLVAPLKLWSLFLFVLLGMMLHIHGYIRGHIHFLRTTFIPAIILLSFLIDSSRAFTKRNSINLIFFVFIFAMVSIPFSEKVKTVIQGFSHPFYFDLERAKGISWDNRGRDYQDLVKYIQKNTSPDERIFVGNSRHDIMFISNDIMLYYLSGRHSATKFHELEVSQISTVAIQKEIISGIERYRVRYIVLDQYFTCPQRFDGGRSNNGVSLLDDFIRREFRPVKQFGTYVVWKRK